jgi:hypothetical protein
MLIDSIYLAQYVAVQAATRRSDSEPAGRSSPTSPPARVAHGLRGSPED